METFARRRRRRRSGRRRTGEKRDATNDDDDGDASSNDGGSSSSAIMMTSILLVGDEGCGKTHAMDAIQRRYSSSSHHDGPTTAAIKILRPDRTVDMVGNTIGSTEDRLIALFAYALERAAAGGNCLVVLDDVDRMFSLSDDDDDDDDNVGSSYHVGGRCRALFVTILDALRKRRSCHRRSGPAASGTIGEDDNPRRTRVRSEEGDRRAPNRGYRFRFRVGVVLRCQERTTSRRKKKDDGTYYNWSL